MTPHDDDFAFACAMEAELQADQDWRHEQAIADHLNDLERDDEERAQ